MRNGNNVKEFTPWGESLSSYPTYEEWKLIYTFLTYINLNFSSYPTYEEWKPYRHFERLETKMFLSYL